MGLESSAGSEDSSPATGQTHTAAGHVPAGAVSVNENTQQPFMSNAHDDAHQELITQAGYVLGARKGSVQNTLEEAWSELVPLVGRDLLTIQDVNSKLLQALSKHRDEGRQAAQAVLGITLAMDGKAVAPPPETPVSAQKLLLEIAGQAELFRDGEGTAYAAFTEGIRLNTYAVRSSALKKRLTHGFYTAKGQAPSTDAMKGAIDTIEARAVHDGAEAAVYRRTAEFNGKIYVDLADEQRRAVEVDTEGWRVVEKPPVYFLRPAGMLPLPVPAEDGKTTALLKYLNLSQSDFILLIAWLRQSLRPKGPYPILIVNGEQGAGKTTAGEMIQALVDPSAFTSRSVPKDERDLAIAARKSPVLSFDNLSGMRPELADAFCRLSTGGTVATRALYENDEEAIFKAERPVILNGIDDLATRGDLAERAIVLTLQPIAESRRKAKRQLWAEFENDRPRMLGALLDSIVHGLAREHLVVPEGLPRMADFAIWAVACEQKPWRESHFVKAYREAAEEAASALVDGDIVSNALMQLMSASSFVDEDQQLHVRGGWRGTAREMLKDLKLHVDLDQLRTRDWPSNERALSTRLRRLAPALLKVGVRLTWSKAKSRKRTRIITAEPVPTSNMGDFASAASVASGTGEKGCSVTPLRQTQTRTQGRKAAPDLRPNCRSADATDITDPKIHRPMTPRPAQASAAPTQYGRGVSPTPGSMESF